MSDGGNVNRVGREKVSEVGVFCDLASELGVSQVLRQLLSVY